ncbi:hypothetical protein [Marinilabilia rubra]|uniref:Uncharacterized protein n=1 Tax=Marinilabilia rubra TaxID=2162893 RepID=A0A2U2B7R9_9BACT|nr:hypothetical protein [Marinilabilia rubra]PWD99108.1 hypothetical protein DDZ16_12715 [Marinilabilia rubra]
MQKRTSFITLFEFLSLLGYKSSILNSEKESSPTRLVSKIQAGVNAKCIVESRNPDNETRLAINIFGGATKTGFNSGLKLHKVLHDLSFQQNKNSTITLKSHTP